MGATDTIQRTGKLAGPQPAKTMWMSGKLIPWANATVHFMSPAVQYGANGFEGIRCYDTPRGPAIFRLNDHLRRFEDTARTFGWSSLPFSRAELAAAAKAVIADNGFKECYVRPAALLTQGGANLDINGTTPDIGIAALPWNDFHGSEARDKGIRAMVSSYVRPHPNSTMTKAKMSGHYVNSIDARTEAGRLGFDEAVMLDPTGWVAECSSSNIFIVRDGRLFTPPSSGVLEGITRDTLLTLAKDLKLEVEEKLISRDQLYGADEIIVCGTATEVIGIRELDGRAIGSGGVGPITKALQKAYSDVVHGKHRRSKEWLTYLT